MYHYGRVLCILVNITMTLSLQPLPSLPVNFLPPTFFPTFFFCRLRFPMRSKPLPRYWLVSRLLQPSCSWRAVPEAKLPGSTLSTAHCGLVPMEVSEALQALQSLSRFLRPLQRMIRGCRSPCSGALLWQRHTSVGQTKWD